MNQFESGTNNVIAMISAHVLLEINEKENNSNIN